MALNFLKCYLQDKSENEIDRYSIIGNQKKMCICIGSILLYYPLELHSSKLGKHYIYMFITLSSGGKVTPPPPQFWLRLYELGFL